MKKLTIGVLLLVLLTTAALTGCGNDQQEEGLSDDAIAKVNGEEISREDFEQVLAMYQVGYEAEFGEDVWEMTIESGETVLEALKQEVSQVLILERLVMQRAEAEGLSVSEEEIDEAIAPYLEDPDMQALLEEGTLEEAFLRGQIEKELYAEKYQEWYLGENEVTDEEIEEFYEENKEVFETLEVRARHILVEEETLARELIERIEEGEGFEELAMAYSTDGSASGGGDLGYFGRGQMVQPFEEAAFSQEVGEVSEEPVETQFGYHIILVEDRIEESESLEDARESIRSHIGSQRFQNHMSELFEEAEIERTEEL